MTVAIHEPSGSTLAIAAEQSGFTDAQVSALQQIGVDKASSGDLQVFFHVCQRTGLDPFARQIHLIGRQVSEMGADGQWTKVTKQTIQTGIDGFRLIGRRAADRAHHKLSVGAAEWAHPDGTWRPVWSKEWGFPVAARVTIHRDGEPFTAVAMFDEYKQTKRGGDLNSMWSQRPAGQIAKCAEALAWRMAFPQDLAGLYSDDEMGQADNRHHEPAPNPTTRLADLTAEPEVVTAEREEYDALLAEAEENYQLLDTTSQLAKRLYATVGQAGIPEEQMHEFLSSAVGRDIPSSKDLLEREVREILDNFDALLAAFMADGSAS
ncbi:MAG: RecT family recombinase [Nocardioides sp.]|uniref:RecT family recombinase n=1 Tax=Nocardioides sp. TaxID=35761 RepID=UPI0039E4CEFC